MKQKLKVINLVLSSVCLIGLSQSAFAESDVKQSKPTVVTGTVGISGNPSVNVISLPPLSISGMPPVSISGTPSVVVTSLPAITLNPSAIVKTVSTDDSRQYSVGFSFNSNNGSTGTLYFEVAAPSVLESIVMSCSGTQPFVALNVLRPLLGNINVVDGITFSQTGLSINSRWSPINLSMTPSVPPAEPFTSLNAQLGIPIAANFGFQVLPDGSSNPMVCNGVVSLRTIN